MPKKTVVVLSLISVLSVSGLIFSGVRQNVIHDRMTAPIPETTLKNEHYLVGAKMIYFSDGEGYYLGDKNTKVAVIAQIASGDFNHDGWQDAAMLITSVGGDESGKTWLAIVCSSEGTPYLRKAIQLNFPAESVDFQNDGSVLVSSSSRYGYRSEAYGLTGARLWKSIE
ncbi:MAG: hypothetical protein KGJ89_03030 [Patescibacteria group bacterium]|nr:hypothetical protein [Patescibacteria group bacterium]MDE2015476.1 hypothetical protein [Patescibacteria group bacterium]MDE2226908.1 hypothetical protein [Patescibacteria group bacterium]